MIFLDYFFFFMQKKHGLIIGFIFWNDIYDTNFFKNIENKIWKSQNH